jgi:hypothetical protein
MNELTVTMKVSSKLYLFLWNVRKKNPNLCPPAFILMALVTVFMAPAGSSSLNAPNNNVN